MLVNELYQIVAIMSVLYLTYHTLMFSFLFYQRIRNSIDVKYKVSEVGKVFLLIAMSILISYII